MAKMAKSMSTVNSSVHNQRILKWPKFKEAAIYIGAGENPGLHKVEDAIIDEVVIYSAALTEEEIKESMDLSIPGVLAVEARDKLAVTWGELKADF